jgi:two-component system sensor histidine kinase TtrS
VRVGVFSFQGAERAESDWASTFKHLRNVLPQYNFQIVPGDLKTLTADVADNRLEFIITNPGHYVELEAKYGAARIATVETQGGLTPSEAVGVVIFTRAARTDIASLHDLRGKRLAAVAAETFGFRQAWREMLKEGVDPFSNLAELSFTDFPVKRVVEAVRAGTADAGVVRTCVIEEMIAKGLVRANEFRVVSARTIPALGCQTSTRLYPDWPFAKLSHTSATLAKQVAQALLSMPVDTNKQDWTVPVDYHSVLELYYDLKIGPYEVLRRHSLASILWGYRYWLALLALTLIWWIIHVVRVGHLIRKRTKELQEANKEARLRREELEHASRLSLVGEMAGSLAHEISQPLAAIANYARGCERRMQQGGDQSEILRGVQQIAVQAERGGEVVRNMRSFVRKRQPSLRRLDPGLLISDTLVLFAPLAERRNVAVVFEPHSSLPAIDVDKLQLEEVLLNLLQNAADAIEGMPEGKVSVRVSSANGVVEIGVADTGPGLGEDAMNRLFETFFTTKPQGLGLGLSLSRSIIESHGGRLWAENIQGGGALFRFTLPVAKG